MLDHLGVQVADVDASVLGLWEAVRHPVGASDAVGVAGRTGRTSG